MNLNFAHYLIICTLICAAIPGRSEAQPKWFGPEPVLGVDSTEPPGIARGLDHYQEIVLTDKKGHLYWQWATTQGVYTNPIDLSDVGATSGPSIAVAGRHKLDAFYRGKNGHLWTSWRDGNWWSAPTDLGGVQLGTAPFAIQGGLHLLQVFYVDTQKRLRYSYYDGPQWWSAPIIIPTNGSVDGPVAVATAGPHAMDVFYRSGNYMNLIYWNKGTWSAPETISAVSSNPTAASFINPGHYGSTVFFLSYTGILTTVDSRDKKGWVTESIGFPLAKETQLAAASIDEVFVMGQNTPYGYSAYGTFHIWRSDPFPH